MNIFFVVAAYNVEEHIVGVVSSILRAGYEHVVVVDDGSSDTTREVLQPLIPRITLIKHIINRGQGAALETGDQYALQNGADIIVHFDGDGQMRVEDVPAMLDPIIKGEVDVTLGSRYLTATNQIPWLKRYVYFPIGRIVNLIFTGLWLSDVHCGFRAFTKEAAQKLVIRQDRMAHATEILEKISLCKLRYKEVPVVIDYHHFGRGLSGINGAFKIVKDLVKAKFFK